MRSRPTAESPATFTTSSEGVRIGPIGDVREREHTTVDDGDSRAPNCLEPVPAERHNRLRPPLDNKEEIDRRSLVILVSN